MQVRFDVPVSQPSVNSHWSYEFSEKRDRCWVQMLEPDNNVTRVAISELSCHVFRGSCASFIFACGRNDQMRAVKRALPKRLGIMALNALKGVVARLLSAFKWKYIHLRDGRDHILINVQSAARAAGITPAEFRERAKRAVSMSEISDLIRPKSLTPSGNLGDFSSSQIQYLMKTLNITNLNTEGYPARDSDRLALGGQMYS